MNALLLKSLLWRTIQSEATRESRKQQERPIGNKVKVVVTTHAHGSKMELDDIL